MSIKIKNKVVLGVIIFASIAFLAFSSSDKKGRLSKTENVNAVGNAYVLLINKLQVPMNSHGVFGDVAVENFTSGGVNYGDFTQGGLYDGKTFLYSGGFMISGKNGGLLWSSAVATASRVEDYVPGTVGMSSSDPKAHLYVVNSQDEPFGESWQEWKDAVSMGAYFYDGDGDGVYNPVDKNGNGVWDPQSSPGANDGEDRPDLLGDETVWCVYNDGLARSSRAYSDQDPAGIEIRQTIWGYATSGDLGNILFIRYSINNAGTVADVYDSVYFCVWDDVDLGGTDGYTDDLIGCDTSLSAGFTYNDGPDASYGVNPPCFLVDFFQGPWLETDNPDDRAYNFKGPILGVDTIPGYVNLPMTSFVHYEQSVGDPDNAQQERNYLLGLTQNGYPNDPCYTNLDLNPQYGAVFGGVDCSTVPPQFMYSGDPVTMVGWINNYPTDQRQLVNTGPFVLRKNQPVDIVVAYIVGRGSDALSSVTEAKRIDQAAQFVYNRNFQTANPPPTVKPVVKTSDNSIELTWNTSNQVKFHEIAFDEGGNTVYDDYFEGFEVYMYSINSTAPEESGLQNSKLIAHYDLANDINTVVVEDGRTFERTVRFTKGTQLDSATYADPDLGRLNLKITTDFDGGPLVKGKPYYFSIVGYALNRSKMVPLDDQGTYLLPGSAFIQYTANKAVIINNGITPGSNDNLPFRSDVTADHVIGKSDATVSYSVVDRSVVTSDEYQVSFVKDSSSTDYKLFYNVTNFTTGSVLTDSLDNYNDVGVNHLFDGVALNVGWIEPKLNGLDLENGAEEWFSSDTVKNEVGPFYVGADYSEQNGKPLNITGKSSQITTLDKMRRVELRFGVTGKAYRYVKSPIRYVYPGDTGDGFVDVPFQAWIVDSVYGEEQQLAVGFLESAFSGDSLAVADGVWNPNTDVTSSREYIVIFDSPYDPNGGNIIYTGTGTGTAKWADIGNGYRIDANNSAVTPEMEVIARSSWFDALYVVGLDRLNDNSPFSPTGKLVIAPDSYPLTTNDTYRYKVQNDLTSDEMKSQFDKVNVYPNPLFAYNSGGSYSGQAFDEPYVTFSNLPDEVTIKIFSLSGALLRVIEKNNTSPFLTWDLKNTDNLRVASGMYIAIVHNSELGDKVLKFAIIMPQKQILKY